MPWTVKITGPGVNDFEFVWQDEPTELPPVDLPEFPALPRAAAGPEEVAPPPDLPPEPPPPVRQRITVTPSPRDPVDAVLPPSRALPPSEVGPQQLTPDAIDQVLPQRQPFVAPGMMEESIPQQDLIDALQPVQQEPEPPRNQQPVRQLYRGILGGPSYLYDLAGAGVKNLPRIASGGYQNPNTPPNPATEAIADYLFKAGQSARDQVRNWTGSEEEPPDVFSRTAKTFGESIVPGKNAGKISTIIGGSTSGVNELRRGLATHSFKDFGTPPDWLEKALVSPAYAQEAPFAGPTGTVQVETVGGPKTVSTGEYMAIGSIALATAGMLFGPAVYRQFAAGVRRFTPYDMTASTPRPRPVTQAAPGTIAISKPRDYIRTVVDDANAGAMNIARRAGIPAPVIQEMNDVFRIQTRATTNAMADSAIQTGRMETPAFTFQARVPLAEIKRTETPVLNDYLHLWDTHDDIRARSISLLSPRQLARRPQGQTVRGYDLLTEAAQRRAIEQAHPEVVQQARAYWDNTRALRRFEASGEYATVSPSRNRQLNRERIHEVPYHPRHMGDPAAAPARGSPVDALAEDMRKRLRERMENEAKGMYVDLMRRQNRGYFTEVNALQLDDNPGWRQNVVSFRRRGEWEHYTTDPLLADVLRMDPYYMTGIASNIIYGLKRTIEVSTTGELQPAFAPVSMIRNWGISKFTTPTGRTSPTALGTLAAIPRQTVPQALNASAPTVQALENMLDRGSNGWLTQVLGPGNVNALSQRMVRAYEESIYAELQTVGGGRGSILQQQTTANNRLAAAIQSSQGMGRWLLESYRTLLNSVHNAAAFDYYRRNHNRTRTGQVSRPTLAAESRNLTGDPRIGGEYYTTVPGTGKARAIRYVNEQNRVSHTAGQAARFLIGGGSELGRTAMPWYNATVQGVKRIGQSYSEDPAKFTARTWLYYIAPTASLYMATHALGNDPNGHSYIDYAMNRRNPYNKAMNWVIPIPGRPVEEGIEFPGFHELIAAKAVTQVAMDHFMGNAFFSESEDMLKAAKSVGGILEPPYLVPGALIAADFGKVAPMGLFGGDSYTRVTDEFDQTGGMPAGMELYARALAPGVADFIGTGYAAYKQTPEDGQPFWNGIKATARRMAEKAPIVRDLTGLKPPMAGTSDITEELFKKSKEIGTLERYYKEWTVQQGQINAKPRSKSGEEVAKALLGERPPAGSAGIKQPPPTNPLYTKFIEQVHTKFIKDATIDTRSGKETGAIGFQSLWDRYHIATKQLRRIRKVNEGNNVTWMDQLEDEPEQLDYLKRNKVDVDNIREVRNFYEHQRHNAARVILNTVREVEKEFSQAVGRPITLKDIKPYLQPGQQVEQGDVTDFVPEVQ